MSSSSPRESKSIEMAANVLRAYIEGLVTAINSYVVTVADDCVSKELINPDVHTLVLESAQSNDEKSRILLNAVNDTVEIDASRFEDVLGILKQHLPGGCDSKLVKDIESDYKECKLTPSEKEAELVSPCHDTATVPELRALYKFYPQLVTVVSTRLESVADQCRAQRIISKNAYRSAISLDSSTLDGSSGGKTRGLLMAIKDAIIANNSHFHTVLSILKEASLPQEELVDDIEREYQRLTLSKGGDETEKPAAELKIEAKQTQIAPENVIAFFTPKLVPALCSCVDKVSGECMSKGLIDREVNRRIFESTSGSEHKARHLLVAVDDCIMTESTALDVFLDILKKTLAPVVRDSLLATIRESSVSVSTKVPQRDRDAEVSSQHDTRQSTLETTLVDRLMASVRDVVLAEAQVKKLESDLAIKTKENEDLKAKLKMWEAEGHSLEEIRELKAKIKHCELEISGLKDMIKVQEDIIESRGRNIKLQESIAKVEQKQLKEKIQSLENDINQREAAQQQFQQLAAKFEQEKDEIRRKLEQERERLEREKDELKRRLEQEIKSEIKRIEQERDETIKKIEQERKEMQGRVEQVIAETKKLQKEMRRSDGRSVEPED